MNVKNEKINNLLFWVFALIFCNFGIALCTKANFGLSMIAAMPYILYIWLRDAFPFVTQGTMEYCWEAMILIVTCIICDCFKFRYLLSFVTAVLCGFLIDFWLFILGGPMPYTDLIIRIITFLFGLGSTAFAIALFFRTTLPLQVYELTVSEISRIYNKDIIKVKRCFDFIMLFIAVTFDLAFNHSFVGLGIGTIIATVFNSYMIEMFGRIIDKVMLGIKK